MMFSWTLDVEQWQKFSCYHRIAFKFFSISYLMNVSLSKNARHLLNGYMSTFARLLIHNSLKVLYYHFADSLLHMEKSVMNEMKNFIFIVGEFFTVWFLCDRQIINAKLTNIQIQTYWLVVILGKKIVDRLKLENKCG